ncbi:hypothetical protein [Longimicrobium sp.]|uniref:hypothetical protein n=1 Tax=Longimicrobium sp. TaxID=2029185 RepID=UPI003B3AD1CA
MKKLKLQIDALKVESFEAADVKIARGTVHGRGPVTPLCDSVRMCLPYDPSYEPCPVYTDRCDSDRTVNAVCTCGLSCAC